MSEEAGLSLAPTRSARDAKHEASPFSGSWWTWTITSSSITPMKTPSSSTSTATRTPTRSRWRRSETVSRPEGAARGDAREKLWLLVSHNLQGCYWLSDKLTDSIGDKSVCAVTVWGQRRHLWSLSDTVTLWSKSWFLCRRTNDWDSTGIHMN